MKRSTFLFIIMSCMTYQLDSSSVDNEMVQMNFANNLYPATPMKNVQALAMKLWGHVDAAYLHPELREQFLSQQEHFTQQVVALHSMLDLLLVSLEKKTEECPECLVKAISDFEYIFQGLSFTADRYKILTDSNQTPLSCVVNYLFETTIHKLEGILQTGKITTPLYAFFTQQHYSSEITLLLPPTNNAPVAPIC
jgi:hypothetical protein